ncbi:hypothetical protein L873DRAFT_1792152 [Choiromyces venosus 120613-1]|uniref:Uncharacterized protein n=1 Tax=Choiromyces venosus 120613-1 TaxID=1336337 RepID=A0A3N4JBK6_9PEZI|nr:hypothetical protein L873DRAFT_1792152 [Choiromyces venosus 120613-1]
MEIVFTGESLLSLKTDISMPSYSHIPIRLVPDSPRCQPSNGTSHVLLASVPAELQASMELVFASEFLLSSKTDILMPMYSLMPTKHVPESPRCQPSNGTCHVLLASVPIRLHAAMQMVFISKFLLTLKMNITMLSHSLTPIRHVLESPQCQHSNSSSHTLLASCSDELLTAMELAFIYEFLLTLKKDITKPRCSPAPIRYVPESP